MLKRLSVRDFGPIKSVDIEFSPGLTALTGDAGAGKSVLLRALHVLGGGRVPAGLVRGEATVEAVFELDDRLRLEHQPMLLPGEHELLIRRCIRTTARGAATANGRKIPLRALGTVLAGLVDLCAQHSSVGLTKAGWSLDAIDTYIDQPQPLTEYRRAYAELRSVGNRLRDAEAQTLDKDARIATLRHELDQLDEVASDLPRYAALSNQVALARCARDVAALAATVTDRVEHGERSLRDQLTELTRLASRHDHPALTPLHAGLAAADEALVDLCAEANRLDGHVEDAQDTADSEARLEAIDRLRLLHRCRADELDSLRLRKQLAYDELRELDETLRNLKSMHRRKLARCRRLARRLHERRTQEAAKLAAEVAGRLRQLGLYHARFEFRVLPTDDLGPSGLSVCRARFSPVRTQPLADVCASASGGELARIMLALKAALATRGTRRCLIFDEVDAGLGGTTAGAVGRQLKELGVAQQVVCVTHAPQIAALADDHWTATKLGGAGTTVRKLAGAARLKELCRMLGDEHGSAEPLARELLQSARSHVFAQAC